MRCSQIALHDCKSYAAAYHELRGPSKSGR